MILMDGRKIAEQKFLLLEEKIKEEGLSLSLAVVWVGEDDASSVYVGVKKKELEKRGIKVNVYKFKEEDQEEEIIRKIQELDEDGIIVQLPLPEKFNKARIIEAIKEEKDVDLLTALACGKLYKNQTSLTPPVVGAVEALLEEYGISIGGKKVALIGAGELVGKPLSLFFIHKGATVSVLNKETEDISFFTKSAKIIVSGAGVPNLIKEDMIEKDSVVIDAGTSRDNGRIVGDVDREAVKMKTGLFSPVPGGVGPLTIYYLAENLFKLKKGKNEH